MLEAIKKRQSIRKYKDNPLSDEQIEKLLKAAMNAPSARNTQSWQFIVIKNKKVLNDVSTMSPYLQMMKSTPCAILVLGEKLKVDKMEYLYYNCSAAIENILIEAVHLGLGSCWCAIGPNLDRIENFRNYFKLSDHLEPISIVSVGYADEEKEIIDRYNKDKITTIE